MEEKTKSFNSIDIAKFVMAILVMTIHISPGLCGSVNDFISNGLARVAVPFFFIASGFFFFRKIDSTKLSNLLKTLKRIFLLFLGWTVVYGIYVFFTTFVHQEQPFLQGFYFLRRHIFLNPYAHLWFLPALMIGMSLGWIFWKFNLKKTAVILGSILYCVGVLGDSYYYLAIKNEILKSFFDVYLQYFTNFRNGIFFGFIFTILYNLFQNKSKKQLFILSTISLMLMLTEYFFVKEYQYALDFNMFFSLLIFTPAFFSLLTKTEINISNQTALFFREYSMGIYFIHPLVKELTFFDAGALRFPLILMECIIIIYIIKKFKIPVLQFLLK